MDLKEIQRRLKILNEKKVPVIDKRVLRGGMQEKLRRQDIRRYGNEIKRQKLDLRNQLFLAENKADSEFDMIPLGLSNIQEEQTFKEPKLKRIKNKRSFF